MIDLELTGDDSRHGVYIVHVQAYVSEFNLYVYMYVPGQVMELEL